MLCRSCRRQVPRAASWCPACGRATAETVAAPFDLVLADGSRVVIDRSLTIGRGPENTVRLPDPSVSRRHARIVPSAEGPRIEDTGSSHGTWLDGRRVEGPCAVHDGSALRLGDLELRIERRRDPAEAGRTIVGAPGVRSPASSGMRPQARPGWALKRLDAAEGDQRYVLRDLRSGRFLRLDEADGELFQLLDGQHSLTDLIAEAERRFGSPGPAQLARLLADLGERGLLEGVAAGGRAEVAPATGWLRVVRPRVWASDRVGPVVDRVYERGGFVLFTRPAYVAMALLAVVGLAAFVALLAGRDSTPFVVDDELALGALVFLAGRFVLVAGHELAHALATASFGRRVSRAGLKVILIFPFVFVDTSEAWFESRRRRMAVTSAGPVADLVLGGGFALLSLILPPGTTRDICFQVALGGYLGACFNLNPLLDRDGYHLLVDRLGEPALRMRAREAIARRLRGERVRVRDQGAVLRYGVWATAWALVAVALVVVLSVRLISQAASSL